MNIYSIYIKDQNKDDDPVVVRQGFSFVAAIFNGLWALYHRMWLFAFVTLAIDSIPIMFRHHHLYDELALVSRAAIALLFGFMATEMREYTLKSNGYELSDVVAAPSEAEAELKFFERSYNNVRHAKERENEESANDSNNKINPFALYDNQEKVKP